MESLSAFLPLSPLSGPYTILYADVILLFLPPGPFRISTPSSLLRHLNHLKLVTISRPLPPSPRLKLSSSPLMTPPLPPPLLLSGSPIQFQLQLRYLGVIFDAKVTFRPHFQSVCTKALKCLLLIRRLALPHFGSSPCPPPPL